MPDSNDSGMAPLRRDAVVASDLIAMRELLKAEAQAIHQLAQTAITALDEKTDAKFHAADAKMEALNAALEEKLEAMNASGLALVTTADESLRREFTARIDAVRNEVLLIQRASEEAIGKAEAATEKRFASVNEFRQQLNDQTKNFATREMVEQAARQRITRFEAAEDRIKDIEQWKSNTEGRQAVRAILWPVMVGVIVFIMTQVMRVMFPAPLAKVPAMYEVPQQGIPAPSPSAP